MSASTNRGIITRPRPPPLTLIVARSHADRRATLISPDYHDPVEIKVSILGEIVYFTYRELLKRRQL